MSQDVYATLASRLGVPREAVKTLLFRAAYGLDYDQFVRATLGPNHPLTTDDKPTTVQP